MSEFLSKSKVNLARFILVNLEKNKERFGVEIEDWPEDAVVSQRNHYVEFDGWDYSYYSEYRHQTFTTSICFDDASFFKDDGEYAESTYLDREEFFAWYEQNPNFIQEVEAKRQSYVTKIAELNQIAYDAVEQAVNLSNEILLPYYCRMPYAVADLDSSSNWDASTC